MFQFLMATVGAFGKNKHLTEAELARLIDVGLLERDWLPHEGRQSRVYKVTEKGRELLQPIASTTAPIPEPDRVPLLDGRLTPERTVVVRLRNGHEGLAFPLPLGIGKVMTEALCAVLSVDPEDNHQYNLVLCHRGSGKDVGTPVGGEGPLDIIKVTGVR